MFCKNCGNKIAENAKFCASCGSQISTINVIKQSEPQVSPIAQSKTAKQEEKEETNFILLPKSKWNMMSIISLLLMIIFFLISRGFGGEVTRSSYHFENEGLYRALSWIFLLGAIVFAGSYYYFSSNLSAKKIFFDEKLKKFSITKLKRFFPPSEIKKISVKTNAEKKIPVEIVFADSSKNLKIYYPNKFSINSLIKFVSSNSKKCGCDITVEGFEISKEEQAVANSKLYEILADSIQTVYTHDHIFVTPNIPVKKLNKAIESITKGHVSAGTVLAIIDNTMTRNCSEGLVFTDEKIFSEKIFNTNEIEYSKIESVKLNNSTIEIKIKDSQEIITYENSTFNMEKFAEILQKIVEVQKQI